MTTYRQDIMANFVCMHDRSTVYPFFRAIFQKMHKHTCQPLQLLMLKISFTKTLFKSNSKFSVILIVRN